MCGYPLWRPQGERADTSPMSVAGGSLGRAAVAAAVLFLGVASVTAQLALDSDHLTTHAAVSTAAGVLQVVASLTVVAAGLVVWFGRVRRSIGAAVLGAAAAFMAPVWIGWQDAPTVTQSTAEVVAPFLLPCLVDIATQFSTRARSADSLAWRSLLTQSAYWATLAYVLIRATLYDPFLDPNCWANCGENTFLVHSAPNTVRVLDGVWSSTVVVLGGTVVLATAAALARPTSAGALDWAVALAATTGVVTAAARAVLSPGTEDPRRAVLQSLFLVQGAALVALACALARFTWRQERRRAAMGQLAEIASEAAVIGSLAEALSRATGRFDLELAYWVPAAQGHVDATGQPLPPGRDKGDVTVLRGEAPVAVIRSSDGSASASLVAEALGPAARLALDNERLRVEEEYHVRQVVQSRTRIVTASDRARRALERDLHDGAQQRLLAVMFSLQMAATAARNRGDDGQTMVLEESVEECRTVLAELREIAHGIFPVILETGGLAAALAHLGDRSRVILSVDDTTTGELPQAVAHAAYLAVARAVAAAAAQDVRQPLTVLIELIGGSLVMLIDGAPAREYVQSSDRVGALGGRLEVVDETLRVVIPCD